MSVPTAVAPSQRYWDPPIAFPWVPIGPFLDVSWIPHVGHAAGRVGAWACPPAGAAHPRGVSRSPCRARPCGTWPGPSCLRRFPGYLAAVQPVLGELCSSVAPGLLVAARTAAELPDWPGKRELGGNGLGGSMASKTNAPARLGDAPAPLSEEAMGRQA